MMDLKFKHETGALLLIFTLFFATIGATAQQHGRETSSIDSIDSSIAEMIAHTRQRAAQKSENQTENTDETSKADTLQSQIKGFIESVIAAISNDELTQEMSDQVDSTIDNLKELRESLLEKLHEDALSEEDKKTLASINDQIDQLTGLRIKIDLNEAIALVGKKNDTVGDTFQDSNGLGEDLSGTTSQSDDKTEEPEQTTAILNELQPVSMADKLARQLPNQSHRNPTRPATTPLPSIPLSANLGSLGNQATPPTDNNNDSFGVWDPGPSGNTLVPPSSVGTSNQSNTVAAQTVLTPSDSFFAAPNPPASNKIGGRPLADESVPAASNIKNTDSGIAPPTPNIIGSKQFENKSALPDGSLEGINYAGVGDDSLYTPAVGPTVSQPFVPMNFSKEEQIPLDYGEPIEQPIRAVTQPEPTELAAKEQKASPIEVSSIAPTEELLPQPKSEPVTAYREPQLETAPKVVPSTYKDHSLAGIAPLVAQSTPIKVSALKTQPKTKRKKKTVPNPELNQSFQNFLNEIAIGKVTKEENIAPSEHSMRQVKPPASNRLAADI